MNNEVYAKFSEEWYSVPTFRISIFSRKIYKFFKFFFYKLEFKISKIFIKFYS